LKQVAEVMLLMLDRVLEAPSIWLMSILPVILWLTLHREDGLMDFMFMQTPSLKTELCRVHELIERYRIQKKIGVELRNNDKEGDKIE
jgi:hypothetical protein